MSQVVNPEGTVGSQDEGTTSRTLLPVIPAYLSTAEKRLHEADHAAAEEMLSGGEPESMTELTAERTTAGETDLPRERFVYSQSKSSALSRLYTGVHGTVQWSSLLNSGGTAPDENLDPMLSIGQAFGFSLGYRIHPRVDIEAGLVLDSRQGSRYLGVVESRKEDIPVTKSLYLHYTQIPLTVRVNAIPTARQQAERVSWHYIGGLQYGLLRQSRLQVEDKNVSPDREIQEHDLSALVGMDCDVPLSSRLFLSVGLRGSMGLTSNSIQGLEGMHQDKRNAVLGLRVGLNGFLGSSPDF